MCAYTENETIKECKKALDNPDLFYSTKVNKLMTWGGETSDTKQPYTEIISKFIIDHFEYYKNGISKSLRTKLNMNHDGSFNPDSNRIEENQIKEKFRKTDYFDYIGEIIDYQIPLKETQSDPKGKIDLLSYRENDQTAIVLEIKKQNTEETMLRCVLECYTYKKQLNLEYLKKEFNLFNCKNIIAAPLVFIGENSKPYMEYQELLQGKRPKLKDLMKILEISPYFIKIEGNGEYKIIKFD